MIPKMSIFVALAGAGFSMVQAETFACNPAHSYPGSSSCISTDGALTLVGPSTTAASATAVTTYACNPAHSYPGSSSCISTDGSLTLVGPSTAASATANNTGATISQITDGQIQAPTAGVSSGSSPATNTTTAAKNGTVAATLTTSSVAVFTGAAGTLVAGGSLLAAGLLGALVL